MEDVTFGVTISAQHKAILEKLADARGISVNNLIEDMIDAENE